MLIHKISRYRYQNEAGNGGEGGGDDAAAELAKKMKEKGENKPPVTEPEPKPTGETKEREIDFFGTKLMLPEKLADEYLKARTNVKTKIDELEAKVASQTEKQIKEASTKEEFAKILAENNALKEKAIAEATNKIKSVSNWAIKSELTAQVAAATGRNLSDPADKVFINAAVQELSNNFSFDPDSSTVVTVDETAKIKYDPASGKMVQMDAVIKDYIDKNAHFVKIKTTTPVGGNPAGGNQKSVGKTVNDLAKSIKVGG